MAGLCDLVEILENNMECVVLKVKDGVQTELVCLGCFDGNETMFRLTKGNDHTCTIFSRGGGVCSWKWGESGYTLVSDSLDKCCRMIESCITGDFGIYIGADTEKRKKTLHIRSLGIWKAAGKSTGCCGGKTGRRSLSTGTESISQA